MQLQLSGRQQTAIATALTILAAAVIVGAIGFLAWLAARFLREFSGVFLPLAVAAVAALVFRPYYAWLERRMPAALALALFFVSLLAPLAGFFWFFGALVVDQVSDLVHRLPAIWERASGYVEARWPRVVEFFQENPVGQRLRAAAAGQQQAVLGSLQRVAGSALAAGAGILHWIGAALGWAVFPVYLAFFLMADPRKLAGRADRQLPFLKEETRRDLLYLGREFVNIIVSFFRGQLVVAFAQGLLFAIGFTAVGLRYGFVLGIVLGFLNVIPYLGSMIGLGVALPLAFFQDGGGARTLVAVLVVFVVVQLIEGYLLTPKVMGDRTGLHPVAIIVSVFFWGAALDGILGMVLAIPLTAFLAVFWRLAREKYIGEIV